MHLKIVTSAEKCLGAAEAWRKQYERPGIGTGWTPTANGDSEKVYLAILKAGNDANEIAAAIGNKSWTHLSCDVCERHAEIAISVGEYDPKVICASCLGAAGAAIDAILRMGHLARKD